MNRRKWTDTEKAYLKRNYKGTNAARLAEHLGRDVQHVIQKASDMKLTRPRRKWRADDLRWLKENYAELPNTYIAEKLGRSVGVIKFTANRLKLSKKPINQEL